MPNLFSVVTGKQLVSLLSVTNIKLKYTLFDWWAIRLRHTCHKQSIVQAMVQRIKKLRNL
jgi:hypothetical protein